mgnify:CR=1 FL=1
MLRITLALAITYFSVGYALENPNQAARLYKATTTTASTIYNKVTTILISGYTHKEKTVTEQDIKSNI